MVPERRRDRAPSTGASWLHLFSTLSCLARSLVASLTISPLFVLLAGRRNLLCIDTNLGYMYVAICGVSKLLRYRAGGAIAKGVQ